MKKALYVSFSLVKRAVNIRNFNVCGQLINGGKIISEASLAGFRERNGNLVFDLPYEIPDGQYTIQINIFTEKGNLMARGSVVIERGAFKKYFSPENKAYASDFEEIFLHEEPLKMKITNLDRSNGYIIFSRSALEHVFPESKPKSTEIINHLAIQVVRNEFEPITFSIYSLQNLGMVKISVTDLKGMRGFITQDKIKVAYIEMVQETRGLPEGKFINLPTLIKPGNQVKVDKDKCQTFWLKLRIEDDVWPGLYKGKIIITPQNGTKISIPLEITVTPISLEDIPGIDYFMLMTYEFIELAMPWSREEKEKIYKSAVNILKNYKDYGMTTLCFHSPFVFFTKEDSTPNLEDILAALNAAHNIGFKRPIIWYMGHLIQTSKPKHPGSIIGFDQEIHLPRLKYLVETISNYTKEHDFPDVIFLPIDEPDDPYQDYQNKRYSLTPLMLKTIKDMGAKNMLTTSHYKQFKPIDYLCSGNMDQEDLKEAHKNGSVYWLYNNDVTTKCLNPTYARYIYGYYTWINNVDGMSSWTFQNTQNASGLPPRSDVYGGDIYLGYPDPNGPLATLKWEAIREGIDDHKLIYQLTKRIEKLKKKQIDVSKYEQFLFELRRKAGRPGCQIGDYQGWDPIFFKKSKDHLVSMILNAEAILQNHPLQQIN